MPKNLISSIRKVKLNRYPLLPQSVVVLPAAPLHSSRYSYSTRKTHHASNTISCHLRFINLNPQSRPVIQQESTIDRLWVGFGNVPFDGVCRV